MAPTREYLLADGSTLVVTLTDEGIIVDLYLGGECIGTWARMADEMAEEVMG